MANQQIEHHPEWGSQQQPLQCSTQVQTKLSKAEAALVPISAKEGTAELLACLTLVAPSGMSAEDRQAWVAVAKEALSGIPADLMRLSCAEVRKRCRFASEIVPMIFEQVESTWDLRKHNAFVERNRPAIREAQAELPRPEPEYVTAEQMRKIIEEVAAERTVCTPRASR